MRETKKRIPKSCSVPSLGHAAGLHQQQLRRGRCPVYSYPRPLPGLAAPASHESPSRAALYRTAFKMMVIQKNKIK